MIVECTLNGRTVRLDGEPLARLLDVLREQQGLTGTKEGCGEGECGACTVLLDGVPVLSCLVPLVQCEARTIETVEGLTSGDAPRWLQRLITAGGIQCGACTPGIVVTLSALLRETPHPTRERIQEALAGNLCRCTGYEGIVRSFADEPGSRS